MRTGESFWCDDTEYELIYLDGVIPHFIPVNQEELDCLDYDEQAYFQGDYDEEVYEHPLARADREAEEEMNIPPSPHLSQPYEDME